MCFIKHLGMTTENFLFSDKTHSRDFKEYKFIFPGIEDISGSGNLSFARGEDHITKFVMRFCFLFVYFWVGLKLPDRL